MLAPCGCGECAGGVRATTPCTVSQLRRTPLHTSDSTRRRGGGGGGGGGSTQLHKLEWNHRSWCNDEDPSVGFKIRMISSTSWM